MNIGQYDNYTPLQLAVYAATLEITELFVTTHYQGIYEGGTDGQPVMLIKNITPKIMDK
ncbi:MAG: hypothetical protein ACLT64_06110 [Streptococcus salivarius]